MDVLRFYVLFNSISVISGRWADDNERLCAMEPRIDWLDDMPFNVPFNSISGRVIMKGFVQSNLVYGSD